MKSALPDDSSSETISSGSSGKLILEVLEQIKNDLPPELICHEGYSRMAEVAAMLPMNYSTFWGMECRLGQVEPLADILFETRKNTAGQELLSGKIHSYIDRLCNTLPHWKKFRDFANRWTDEKHPFNAGINNIWLEFDTAEAETGEKLQKAINQPNFFFGPDEKLSSDEVIAAILEIMEVFKKSSPGHAAIKSFVNSLPDSAKLFQVGLMLTREDDHGLRMCVSDIQPEKIPAWLVSLQPDMDRKYLESFFREIMPLIDHVTIGLNLEEKGIDKTIGVECYMDWLNDDPMQWSPLLDYISEAGLCLSEKKQGIYNYPGTTSSSMLERIDTKILYMNTFRKIHHLKITVSGGIMTQAKAYFAVSRPGIDIDNLKKTPNDNSWGGK